jgi:dihydroxyacetone kinase
MLVAWRPAADAALALARTGAAMRDCLNAASEAAGKGAAATADMHSAKGRSKKLGKRVLGHVDPGAESAAILISAWADNSARR